jgi:NitT/TauT family transport system substrate-binding protein
MLNVHRKPARCAAMLLAAAVLGACAPSQPQAGAKPAPAPASAPTAAGATTPTGAGATPPSSAGGAATSTPAPAAPTHVRISTARTASDAGLAIAADKGYFLQEGIEPDLIPFPSTSEMIPAVGTGQVDTVTVGPNPATLNALARGIQLKAVLDTGSFRPGVGYQSVVVRKELYDRGQGHELTDLRGMSMGLTPPGKATTSACGLANGLQRVGMTLDDLNIVPLTFPDMVPALANGAVDSALMSEPFKTRALRQGTIVATVPTSQLYPNFALGLIAFSTDFYNDRPAGKAFARAYVKAIRELLDARAGRLGDAHRAELEEIIARGTGLDAATVHDMELPGFNPNGVPTQEGMLYCYQFFRDLNLVPEPVSDATFAALWGTDLIEEVLTEIGRVPES